MLLTLISAIGAIVLVDLALSGDNALVIGVAAAALPQGRERRTAILAGGAVAIVLRIIFAIAATFLLQLPFLQAIGGVALLYIAARMLWDRNQEEAYAKEETAGKGDDVNHTTRAKHQRRRKAKATPGQTTLLAALTTIVIADLTMSLDNVLAIGALANGNLIVLTVGLLLSVSLLLVGSALVARVMGRLPWLLDLATLVLAWTAGNMFLEDKRVGPYLHALPGPDIVIPIVLVVLVLALDIILRATHRSRRPPQSASRSIPQTAS